MRTDFDVAVLGAGISGTAAALAASDAGARVCVITGAPGSSALFSGGWRGALPEPFRTHLGRVGYQLQDCTHPLPHPNGARARCESATSSHQSAQLSDSVLVCGIAGLPGFDATMLARVWSAPDQQHAAVTISLAATPRAGWAPASLAACLERDARELTRALTSTVQSYKPARIVLPAVLGIDGSEGMRAALQNDVDVIVGEALGVAPSLPGWRLQEALTRALRHAGVQLFQGRARAADPDGPRVRTVTLDGATVQAQKFVLATGKFISGGIAADGELREPAFNCPVWIEHLDNVFTTPEPLMLTDPERTEPQPLLSSGVHADSEHRPVNREGDVVYENVFVAGSVRADWNSTSHGAGDCASDGWAAGQRAVRP